MGRWDETSSKHQLPELKPRAVEPKPPLETVEDRDVMDEREGRARAAERVVTAFAPDELFESPRTTTPPEPVEYVRHEEERDEYVRPAVELLEPLFEPVRGAQSGRNLGSTPGGHAAAAPAG